MSSADPASTDPKDTPDPKATSGGAGAPRQIKRILLKISGESLGEAGVGVAPKVVADVAEQIARVHRLGVEVAVVCGGGNLLRGAEFAKMGTNRATADHMGMLGTAINALALQDGLERCGVETRACCAVEMKTVAEPYIRRRAIRHLEKGRAVVLAGGTGNPYFTTDTAAALRATELAVDAIFKATKVDGVYSADPAKDPSATRFDRLTFHEALDRNLQVMDRTAFTLCMENRMPIMVFDMFQPGNMERAVRGEAIGTWVV
ncbi:MAG TPA: UMP kinase [bacterium]|nr:UMP kinase [bacterium]